MLILIYNEIKCIYINQLQRHFYWMDQLYCQSMESICTNEKLSTTSIPSNIYSIGQLNGAISFKTRINKWGQIETFWMSESNIHFFEMGKYSWAVSTRVVMCSDVLIHKKHFVSRTTENFVWAIIKSMWIHNSLKSSVIHRSDFFSQEFSN